MLAVQWISDLWRMPHCRYPHQTESAVGSAAPQLLMGRGKLSDWASFHFLYCGCWPLASCEPEEAKVLNCLMSLPFLFASWSGKLRYGLLTQAIKRCPGTAGKQVSRNREWHTLKAGIAKTFTKWEYFIQTVIGLKYTHSSKELLKLSSSLPALWVPRQSLCEDATQCPCSTVTLGVGIPWDATVHKWSSQQTKPPQSSLLAFSPPQLLCPSASPSLLPPCHIHCKPGQMCRLTLWL